MSFETTAELDLVVSDQALRQVRGQVESELGAIEVGTTDGGTMSAQSARSGSGGSRRRRQSMRMERTQTEHLEDIALYLESIDDVLSEGGLLGGGGGLPGSGIFAEVVGSGVETAGDVAVEAGDTVAEAVSDVLTGTAASALGNTISSAITGSEVAVEDTTLTVERPEWVDEVGGSNSRNINVDTTFSNDISPEFTLPETGLGIPGSIDVVRDPIPVQRDPLPVEDTTLRVEDIEPLDVEDVGPITVAVETSTRRGPTPTGPDSEPTGGVQIGGENGITLGPGGIQAGGDDGITLGRDPGDPTGTQSRSNQSQSRATPTREVTVTHSPTYQVDVDPRRLDSLAERIISEIEDGVQRDIDELEDDVDELERELEELERGITRGR